MLLFATDVCGASLSVFVFSAAAEAGVLLVTSAGVELAADVGELEAAVALASDETVDLCASSELGGGGAKPIMKFAGLNKCAG